MDKKMTTWTIQVYRGWSDWDDGDKYSYEYQVSLPTDEFTKDDVQRMFATRYKEYRFVTICATKCKGE